MSDSIKHECGLAVLRLKKPLEFYHEKYGTALYGLYRMQLLMQKMRNRGQDGAGIVTIKLDAEPGKRYISRKRSNSVNYLQDLFNDVFNNFRGLKPSLLNDPPWLQKHMPYTGELLMGHLRYGTHGANTIETVHPFLRQNNWISRNLVLAGNFNLTNVEELFAELVSFGQYPKEKSDTVTILEKIGHFLDDEVQRLFNWYKPDGYTNEEINQFIFDNLDIQRLLRRACKKFDGGYVMGGLIGHGDAFIIRDPNGIRPAYWYEDDEVVAMASERPAIQTALTVSAKYVKELEPGHALIIRRNGNVTEVPFMDQPAPRKACSFERIYFSKGTDRDIYLERKKLGEQLVVQTLEKVNYDFENTVFSFVPNTSETAFFGFIEGLQKSIDEYKRKKLLAESNLTEDKINEIMNWRPRIEKLVVKDEKLRTFIADEEIRAEMVGYVYDVTYGIVRNKIDTLVLIDDSIVRGTTLRNSILRNLARLKPKKIIILSSCPQIRYPDCYGIDMSKMSEFVAFQALVELLKKNNKEYLLDETYQRCKAQEKLPKDEVINQVKALYKEFTPEEISAEIAMIVKPSDLDIEIDVLYQSLEGLHAACPNHTGDWYFSGDYPTPGGNKVANRAFTNYMERINERAYA
ncbi:MAG: amidophosphoribosyltransferase [Saprospiraceae bacterium]